MKVLIKRSDGGVSILTLTHEANSVQEEIEKWKTSHPSQYLYHREVSEDDIPSSREFRNAWSDETELPSIDIDLQKAKDLKLHQLRAERNKKLEELDKKFMIAFEQGLDLNNIKEEKKRLRDITEPLKNLSVEGYNDENILQQIRDLAELDT